MCQFLVALGLSGTSALATAAGWQCTNAVLEVSCTGTSCRATSEFTPMHVTIDAANRLSVCAYSGCWEGAGRAVHLPPYCFVTARQLAWSGHPAGSRETFALMLDTSDGIALLKGAGFAQPLHCTADK